jgi:hypothetical protein
MLRRLGLCCLALAMMLCTTSLPADESRGIAPASVIRNDWMRQAVVQNENGPLTAEDDAAGGCDGVKNGLAGFHTQKEQNPWWQVNLGSRMKLGRIVIWNRTNDAHGTQRARRLAVWLSADGWTPAIPGRSVRRARVGGKGNSCQPPSRARPGKDIDETSLRGSFIRVRVRPGQFPRQRD